MVPITSPRRKAVVPIALTLAASVALAGCSVKKFAIARLGDSLASSGGTYESDDDLELVGEALPFSLKLMESLVAEVPDHQGLRLACAKGFASYAYAYVQQPADMQAGNLEQRDASYARARRLYARALENALAGFEVDYPGFGARLRDDPVAAAGAVRKQHVPLLYWTSVSLGLSIALATNDAAMLGRLREVDALLDRALALDEGWQQGALHELALTLEGARPPGGGRNDGSARRHYERALALSQGRRASVHVALAESVLVPEQDLHGFREALERALAVDPDAATENRLANLIAQRRARWLLTQEQERFLVEDAHPSTTRTTTGGLPWLE